MPLPLPNLDDRRYKDLVNEGLALIPTHAPEWTNHNPSDPGIALVELFAHLTEILVYRLNRVTPANLLSFLKLLNGSEWRPLGKQPDELTPEEIMEQIPQTIRNLRRLERAVTSHDFETLALEASPDVVRAHCLPRRNLEGDKEIELEGHVSLIVVPVVPTEEAEIENRDVLLPVLQHLTPKLLITTQLHVVEPIFVELTIEASVVLMPDRKAETDIDRDQLITNVFQELERFFNPRPDLARNTQGWPFGRNVFVSEVYALLDQLPFIDYVTKVDLKSDKAGRELPDNVGIEIKPYELVKVKPENVIVKFEGVEITSDQIRPAARKSRRRRK
jgi:Baseplate J-like protein